ncbi:MAG: hypothetical protein LAO03_09110 [Acidobacteriia bacterium]|nr:hypothetical protein [Terriglobia bacterium]
MKLLRISERVSTVLVLLWIVPGIVFLLSTAVAVVRQPGFHVGLGLIQAMGSAALLATLVPALWGTAALIFLFRARVIGARLLIVYCLFWLGDFLGALIYNWRDIARDADVLNGPMPVRIIVSVAIVVFLGCFALCAVWAWRRAQLRG